MFIKSVIDKYKNKFTVIMPIAAILEAMSEVDDIENFKGLKEHEIGKKFNVYAQEFGQKPFANSYVQRHTGENKIFLVKPAGEYLIQPNLLENCCKEDCNKLVHLILTNWKTLTSGRSTFLKEIEQKIDEKNNSEELSRYLKTQMIDAMKMFLGDAQIFEIFGYSILSVYFSTLGFSLRRFSTTFSNDGGIDIIAANCIYQLTLIADKRKIDADLKKLSTEPRIYLTKSITDKAKIELYHHSMVNEILTNEDLEEHFLGWLVNKDQKRGESHHLKKVLETILQECKKEFGML